MTPTALALRTAIYYIALLTTLFATLKLWPESAQHLPVGGHDALGGAGVQSMTDLLRPGRGTPIPGVAHDAGDLGAVQTIMLFLVGHLTGTVLAMLPIAWTYKAMNFEAGFRKNFVRSLIVLPLCATTTVLLIQDSLALAFGLAALVAAVRFRVALDEAMDGIFIFAAICVGLAAGIGFIGIALVMSMFFCFANIVMWAIDYGRNPVDEARQERKRAKQDKAAATAGDPGGRLGNP
jgi:hypothetical protein